MSRHPTIKWAQRSDVLYFTIDLPNTKDVKLKLEPEGKLYFYATGGADNIPYELDINLYDEVDVNGSKASIGSRNIVYLIKKAESKWWSRLLKEDGKPPIFLKADWDKWVDEDEQDETSGPEMDLGDIDFSNLNMVGEGNSYADGGDDEEYDESETEEETKEDEENKEDVLPASTEEAAPKVEAKTASTEVAAHKEVEAKA